MTSPRMAAFAFWTWRWRTWLRAVPILLLGAVVAYGLIYLWTMRIEPMVHFSPQTAMAVIVPTPTYAGQQFLPRRWQPYVTMYFEPANRIDRTLRPTTWNFSTCHITTDEEFEAWGLK
jgi:hypothetical protein